MCEIVVNLPNSGIKLIEAADQIDIMKHHTDKLIYILS